MQTKLIIGFLGDNEADRTTASEVLKKMGCHIISINDKVREFASYLLDVDMDPSSIHEVRMRGYGVNTGYWLNQTLVSVPDSVNNIVIKDLYKEDIIKNLISPYQIVRKGEVLDDEKIPDTELILNDGNLKEFERKIETIFRPMLKRCSK